MVAAAGGRIARAAWPGIKISLSGRISEPIGRTGGRDGAARQLGPSGSGSGGAANNLGLWEPGGIDFDTVFRGLHEIGYTGYFTVHPRTSQGIPPRELATRSFEFLKPDSDGVKG